ncbi:MAG: efflux RND transporter permease subunit, partial [bacterium]
MRFIEKALQHWQFVMVITILLVANGTVSFFTMPRSEDPQIDFAGSSIVAVLPGASSSDLEALVVEPVEESLNELEDIKHLSSTMKEGVAVIHIEFKTGTDPDEKYREVISQLDKLKPQLPPELFSLEAKKYSSTDVNIIQYAIVSQTAGYKKLKEYAEKLKKQLLRVHGIKNVNTYGYPDQKIKIMLNMEKMASLGISSKEIFQAIASTNANIPGGFISAGARNFTVKTSGDFKDMEQIRNTAVRAGNNNIVQIRDIAKIRFEDGDTNYLARFNGKTAVFICASQQKGTNIFQVTAGLEKEIDNFKNNLEPGISLKTVFKQSQSVQQRLNGFFKNLLQGMCLVGLIVFLTLGFNASIIICAVIPVSILTAIGLIHTSGYGLNQISIVALVIALGLLVDNAIVVVENISRFMRHSRDAHQASMDGTGQIGWAIVSSTLTTVLAFLPMLLLKSMTGDFIRSLPVSVIFVLTSSLLFSLTLTPYLCRRFLKYKKQDRNSIAGHFLDRMSEGPYLKLLTKSLNNPFKVLLTALIFFIAILLLFPFVGVSLFPKAEKPQIIINIETPQEASINKTDSIAGEIETLLSVYPWVVHTAANVGQGNPRIYYNMFSLWQAPNIGEILVQLNTRKVDELAEIVNVLRDKCSKIPGALIEIKEFQQGPPIAAAIAIRVIGENLGEIYKYADKIQKIIFETNGTVNVRNDSKKRRTDLFIKINRQKAALLGIPLSTVDQA